MYPKSLLALIATSLTQILKPIPSWTKTVSLATLQPASYAAKVTTITQWALTCMLLTVEMLQVKGKRSACMTHAVLDSAATLTLIHALQ